MLLTASRLAVPPELSFVLSALISAFPAQRLSVWSYIPPREKGKAPISSIGGGDDGDFSFLSRLTNRESVYHGTTVSRVTLASRPSPWGHMSMVYREIPLPEPAPGVTWPQSPG